MAVDVVDGGDDAAATAVPRLRFRLPLLLLLLPLAPSSVAIQASSLSCFLTDADEEQIFSGGDGKHDEGKEEEGACVSCSAILEEGVGGRHVNQEHVLVMT